MDASRGCGASGIWAHCLRRARTPRSRCGRPGTTSTGSGAYRGTTPFSPASGSSISMRTSGSASRPAAPIAHVAGVANAFAGRGYELVLATAPEPVGVTHEVDGPPTPAPADVRTPGGEQPLPVRPQRRPAAPGSAAAVARLPAAFDRQLRRRDRRPPQRSAARARVQRLRGLGGAPLGPAAPLRTARARRRRGEPAARKPRRHDLADACGRARRARRRSATGRLAPERRGRRALRPGAFLRRRTTGIARSLRDSRRCRPRHLHRHVRAVARRRRARADDPREGRSGRGVRASASCSSATG